MARSGFTLIELIIVLFVIGLGWFSVLPRLGITSLEKGTMDKVNIILAEARDKAVTKYDNQSVMVTLGSADMTWGDKSAKLPGELERCRINDITPTGLTFAIRFFPDGHSDEVKLYFQDNAGYEIDPLVPALVPIPAEDPA